MKFNITLIILFFSILVNAQEEYRKDFHQVYPVSKTDLFDISNRFGVIKITNSTTNEITIDAEIIVKASSKDKADKVMEKIKVDIQKNGSTVTAVTTTDNISGNNIQFEINYNVKMPSYLSLNLKNKYGKVYIDELHNKSNISVKYGSLELKNLTDGNDKPLSTIELGYCDNSTIKELNWAKVIISYSKLSIDEAKAIVLSSKYSNIKLGNLSSCVAESAYDDYEIGEISNLVINTKYSDLDINTLKKKLEVDTKYGDVTIDRVDKDFEAINATSEYADISIGLPVDGSYLFEASSNYGDIKYSDIEIFEKVKDNQAIQIKGFKGNKSSEVKVKLSSSYGDIIIK